MDFWGKRLKILRKSKGWSQGDVAKASNTSLEYVGKIERGEVSNVGTEVVEALAKALHVHPSLLLWGEIIIPKLTLEEENDEIGPLNADEKRLVSQYRAVPRKEERAAIQKFTETYANLFKKVAKK